MPDAWLPVRLADLVEIKHGFAFGGEYFRDDPPGDILLTLGNFAIGGGFKDDKFKYYAGPVPEGFVLSEGDLLVTMTDLSKAADTLGYPALVPQSTSGRFLHNQRLGKVLIFQGANLDKKYLYFLMRTRPYRHEVIASATGTTVKHTSPDRIRAYRFLLPPLDEQRAIADVLGSLDDKIELNRRMNRTLEQMAAAIFKAWFVDFEPVKAKAAGAKSFPSMPQPVFDALPTTFTDSPLGPIPKGWRTGTVSDVASLSRASVNPADHPTELVDHFSIPAFDEGRTPKREPGDAIQSNKFEVVPGSVLVSKLNPRIPRVWLPPTKTGFRRVASTEFLVLMPNPGFGREYVYALTTTDGFQEVLAARATGT